MVTKGPTLRRGMHALAILKFSIILSLNLCLVSEVCGTMEQGAWRFVSHASYQPPFPHLLTSQLSALSAVVPWSLITDPILKELCTPPGVKTK